MTDVRKFWTDEDGGATVEWVVLTALLAGGATFMFEPVEAEVMAIARTVEARLESLDIPTTFAEYASLVN